MFFLAFDLIVEWLWPPENKLVSLAKCVQRQTKCLKQKSSSFCFQTIGVHSQCFGFFFFSLCKLSSLQQQNKLWISLSTRWSRKTCQILSVKRNHWKSYEKKANKNASEWQRRETNINNIPVCTNPMSC